jgi:hypothetical protein
MPRLLNPLPFAALTLAVSVCAAHAQPPVARPQPPPAAPATKLPPKPGPTTATTPATTPATAPATAPAAPQPQGPKPKTAPAAAQAAPARSAAAVDAPEVAPAACRQGAPVLAGAQYLASYDAGMGQTYCLYGSAQAFADVVAYYRTVLKDRGELVFDAPATHMFEVGKFKEAEVAFPPGVTVKDYTWGGSPGYMNPILGASPGFFPTVIQIVPPPAAGATRRE